MVSIVIPTFNGSQFVRDALTSCFAQSHLAGEVVVADDCSTDSTLEVVRSVVGPSQCPLRVVRLERNSGSPAAPINAGVRECSGAYVHVLDQDDVLLPRTLMGNVGALERCPSAGVVVNWSQLLGGDGTLLQRADICSEVIRSGTEVGGGVLIQGRCMLKLLMRYGMIPLGFPGFTFRRSVFDEVGGVNEGLRVAGDYDLLCRMMRVSDCFVAPVTGYLRRIHENNITRHRGLMYLELNRIRLQLLRTDDELSEDSELSYLVCRQARRS